MKVEIDIDKIINDHSKRRMELMRYICETHIDDLTTLKIVNELRYLSGVLRELEKLKNKH